MKGLELSRNYYEAYGAGMIHEQFPEYEEIIAVGLTGSGSECYGFDDEVSRDHDFEPGFCLFLPDEEIVDRKTAFQLERAYAKLPEAFEGFHRQRMNPAGGNRHGVIRISDFFRDKIGCMPEDMRAEQWLTLPESALAEAVNGEIFRDDAGLMTDARSLLQNMPEDYRRKRLAGHLLAAAQSGQYNYGRCIAHGDSGAAQLAVFTFVQHAMSAWFLMERKYMPYYKWSFRALRELQGGREIAEAMERLITTGNSRQDAEEKRFLIEKMVQRIIRSLEQQGLTEATCGDLGKHAYSVNDGIRDGNVRNLHILYTVT